MPGKHDHIGAETLRRMSALERYNDWVMERISPYIGNSVLEVGSGIGNFSQRFVDRERLVLTDISRDHLDVLASKFDGYPHVSCELYDLEKSGATFYDRGIDTVIALNVLEHIENDVLALEEMYKILAPGGRLILQLPAHTLLYGSLDINLDHFRRYTMRDICKKFADCGFVSDKMLRMNMFGTAGWLVYSRIFKKDILPEGSLGLFNLLTPLFMTIERYIPAPFGLSIIAVGQKRM